MSIILGVNGGINPMMHHDPSACILVDGELIAAAEEERFVRVKNALGRIPINSISYCLEAAGISINEVDHVASPGPVGKDLEERIERYLKHYFGFSPSITLFHHQLCHAAHSFYMSGFAEALAITFDGYGDKLSGITSIFRNGAHKITGRLAPLSSLGMFYSSMSSFLGFEPGEGEYKVMGLAPYGTYLKELKSHLFSSYSDETGIFTLKPSLFRNGVQEFNEVEKIGRDTRGASVAISRFEPWYTQELTEILGPPRSPLETISQHHKDIAATTQEIFEDSLIKQVEYANSELGIKDICLGGGCALNCVALSKLGEKLKDSRIFVPPGANDSGLSIGSAFICAEMKGEDLRKKNNSDPYLGPSFSGDQVKEILDSRKIAYEDLTSDVDLYIHNASRDLKNGRIIGWFNGRLEFGARALGNRSILASPIEKDIKSRVNQAVKFREGYRPFAPSVLEERAAEIFEMNGTSPYMNIAPVVRPEWRKRIPGVVHVDGTSRVHTVSQSSNELYSRLISEFNELTGVPLLLNTSLNVKDEAIAGRPQDALATFYKSGIDSLYIEGCIVRKTRV